MNLKELEKRRDDEVTSFFWLALYIIFIFGIPALIAVWGGNKLNEVFGVKGIQFGLLFLAFVSSWGIIARIYVKKTRTMKAISEEIKKAKEIENTNNLK